MSKLSKLSKSTRLPAQAGRSVGKLAKRPSATKAPDLLLDRIIDEFVYAYQQIASPATVRTYKGTLHVFSTFLRDKLGRDPLLSDLTLQAAQEWGASLQQRPKLLYGGQLEGDAPMSVESRRSYLRTLRVFSNWLIKEPYRYCAESPLRYLTLPRPSQTYKLPLTEEELARLLASVANEPTIFGARDLAMLLLLIDGGVRAMELAKLRIADVTLASGLILVAHGKGGKTRAVTVGDDTRQALRRYAVLRDSQSDTRSAPDQPFFQSALGKAFGYAGLRSWLRRIAVRAGVPRAHLHLIRHTSAVETLAVGADLRTLQLKLGHSSIMTTQCYLNMASQQLSERQREFSPVDRLRLMSPGVTKAAKAKTPIWRHTQRATHSSTEKKGE